MSVRELLTQEASVLMSVYMNVGDAYVPEHTLFDSNYSNRFVLTNSLHTVRLYIGVCNKITGCR